MSAWLQYILHVELNTISWSVNPTLRKKLMISKEAEAVLASIS